MASRALLPTLLAAALTLALTPALEAQVRRDLSRQLRVEERSPCGRSSCLHRIDLDRSAPPQRTGVSGHDMGQERLLSWSGSLAQPAGSVVSRFELGERGDEPCMVAIRSPWHDNDEWDACGGNGPRTVKSAHPNSNQVLVGVQVCHNDRNDDRGRLVKGVRLEWAHHPGEVASARRGIHRDQIRQPNCRRWQPWVRCPVGTGAPSVVVHHIAIGGRRGAVGLQLECYPAEPLCYDWNDPFWDGNLPEAACLSDE